MKIFLSFLQGKPGHPIPAYSFWEYYIKNGIEEAGYGWTEMPEVDWAYGLVPQSKESLAAWKEEAWNKTIDFIKVNKVDLFLSYLYPHQVDTDAISQIKQLGVPAVNFFCDNIREFRNIPEEYKIFDLNWVPEYKALKMYKKAGFNFLHLPMPVWVEPKFRVLPLHEIPQVSFIGSHDKQRQLLFENVVQKPFRFDLNIYGAAWLEDKKTFNNSIFSKWTLKEKILNQVKYLKNNSIKSWYRKIKQRDSVIPKSQKLINILKSKPSFNDYVNITQSSLVTLGVNRYPSFHQPLLTPDTYSRLRDIEAPMLGACYLTEWTEGIDEMYEIGHEIETYTNAEELVAKAEALVLNKEKRCFLRKNAQIKALEKHSIPHTIQQIKHYLSL